MRQRDSFSSYHPLAELLFFASVMGFTMFFQHPVSLLISFVCACAYYVSLTESRGRRFILKFALPVAVITAIANPLLSHEGVTILFYLPSKNPFTLESVFYGVSAGVMLSAVMTWFFCFSEVMTSDKFVYLFSRLSPSLSLLISMTLRFVPLFRKEFETISETQNALDLSPKKSKLRKAETAISCFTAVMSRSLENAVETADSMKSRGYGTGRRTAYSKYKIEKRDKSAIGFILFCTVFIVCGGVSGALKWRYYPDITGEFNVLTIILLAAFSALCIMPVYLKRREEREWKRLISQI